MPKPSKAKKAASIKVDFTGVETAGVVDEGDYAFEVDEVEVKTSDNSGEDYLAWTLKIDGGDFNGKKLFHNTSLQPQALFNLRSVLEALGYEVPEGAMDLDPADLIGEKGACSVAHEKYQGKTKARPVEFFTIEELENRGEEEETPAKPAKKGKAAKEEDDDPPAKPAKKGAKAAKEEEEEPAKPAAKKKAKAKAPEFEDGDEVTFEDDEGNELTGTITSVDGDDYTVTVGKGKKATEWTLEADDMTKVEE